jgi:HlyD family secretion protein
MNRFVKGFVGAGLLLTGLGLAGAWLMASGGERSISFLTAPVKRGDLLVTISATGTVEPEELVDVGSQVAGKITAFGRDQSDCIVDYGSTVEEGTVLARIDESLYFADVAQARAQLANARAGVVRAEADLGQMQAKLSQTQHDWDRARKLGPSSALSPRDYDGYQSAYETARANLDAGKAAIVQAATTVAQAEAALLRAQQNLDYCTIKSPVRGVIIDRRVNIGQTVVASLSAPSLFLIARDLRRMQVWVSVNEADIGSIRPGQPVTFTVDAYPDQTFKGEVKKTRLNASMTQNVVTYTVEVVTDNSDGRLLPYLTANVKFQVNERSRVLLAPNAALRYTPSPDRIAWSPGSGSGSSRHSSGAESHHGGAKTSHARAALWAPEGGLVRPIIVEAGLSDGTMTEVGSDDLKEETMVVVGEEQEEPSSTSSSGSPFAPRLFSGSKGGGHGH